MEACYSNPGIEAEREIETAQSLPRGEHPASGIRLGFFGNKINAEGIKGSVK